MKKIIDYIVFSSVFVSFCAVALMAQTVQLLSLDNFNSIYYLFTFGGTIASYNLHWYFKENNLEQADSAKKDWTDRHAKSVILLTVLGLLTCIILLPIIGQKFGWLMFGGALSMLYTSIKIPYFKGIITKYIAISKTIYLALTWTFVTAILPVILSDFKATLSVILFIFYRFLFMLALCILFDARDRNKDISNDMRTTLSRLSELGIKTGYYVTLFMASILVGWWGFLIKDSLLLMTKLGIPLLILSLIYTKTTKSNSDYLYYLVIDGIMGLSWLITL